MRTVPYVSPPSKLAKAKDLKQKQRRGDRNQNEEEEENPKIKFQSFSVICDEDEKT